MPGMGVSHRAQLFFLNSMERHRSLAFIHRTAPEDGGQRGDCLLCLHRHTKIEIGGVIMTLGEFGVGSL